MQMTKSLELSDLGKFIEFEVSYHDEIDDTYYHDTYEGVITQINIESKSCKVKSINSSDFSERNVLWKFITHLWD